MPYKRQGGKYAMFAQTMNLSDFVACINNHTPSYFGMWLFIQAVTCFPDGPMPYKRQGGKYKIFVQTESSSEIIACMNNYTQSILGYDYSCIP